jgi:hypothetical protein
VDAIAGIAKKKVGTTELKDTKRSTCTARSNCTQVDAIAGIAKKKK